MSGILRGTVDARIANATEFRDASEVFKLLFDAMEAHPNTTRIALSYGDGTGTDYYDGANPFGRKSFAVWRWEPTAARTWPFYTMFYTNSNGTEGTADSNWQGEGGIISAGNGQVFTANAVGVGGDENPWGGTTNNDGTDTVSGKRWDTPAGGTGLIIAPATNRDGSEDDALRRNCMAVFSLGSPTSANRFSFIADDDGFIVYSDEADNLVSPRVCYIGMYEPVAHLTVPKPFVCIAWTTTMNADDVITDERGAISGVNENTRVVSYTWDKLLDDANFGPDRYAEAYVPQRIVLFAGFDATDRGFLGWLPDTITTVTGGSPGSVNAAKTKVILGLPANTRKYLLPWDGVTIPFSTMVRQGVSFP